MDLIYNMFSLEMDLVSRIKLENLWSCLLTSL